jgi:long-chain acyl-CoA synthetase
MLQFVLLLACAREVVAFIVAATEIDDRELRTHCRALIAPYKIPGRFIRIDALPRSDTGKVLKRLLVDNRRRDAD